MVTEAEDEVKRTRVVFNFWISVEIIVDVITFPSAVRCRREYLVSTIGESLRVEQRKQVSVTCEFDENAVPQETEISQLEIDSLVYDNRRT